MRSRLAALAVVVVSVLLLSRAGLAGPPPAMEQRDIKKAIAALEKRGVEGWVIGQLVSGKPGIEVI